MLDGIHQLGKVERERDCSFLLRQFQIYALTAARAVKALSKYDPVTARQIWLDVEVFKLDPDFSYEQLMRNLRAEWDASL